MSDLHSYRDPQADASHTAATSSKQEQSNASNSDRRQRLIDLIVEHHLLATGKKIKLKELADKAGISRQALDRYYGDLKPYIAGDKDISDLVEGIETKNQINTQVALTQIETKYKAQIQRIIEDHDKSLKHALDSHITTLMNNDLVVLQSHTVRTSLERQTLHNEELRKKIDNLELKLALAADGHLSSRSDNASNNSNKLAFNVDIENLYTRVGVEFDINKFEDAKDNEIFKIREKLIKFSDVPNVHVVIFSDRYLSRFSTFVDNYIGNPTETALIVRLPLFSRSEILNFTKYLPAGFRRSIYIPYCASDSDKKAQREFMFQKLPAQEAKGADNADSVSITWGFDEVVVFKIRQGD